MKRTTLKFVSERRLPVGLLCSLSLCTAVESRKVKKINWN